VLIEESDGEGSFTGYARNFISASIRAEVKLEAGTEVNARITEYSGGKLRGHIL